jgi:hypothetical protein
MCSGCISALEGRGGNVDTYGAGSTRKSSGDAFATARRSESSEQKDTYGIGEPRRKASDASSESNRPAYSVDPYGVGSPRKSSPDDAFTPARRTEPAESVDTYSLMRGQKALSEQVVVINRPPSIQGLTGLLVTDSAFTQPAGKLALGVSVLAEHSKTPDYSVYQMPLTFTWGLSNDIEVGLKGKALATENVNGTGRERGAGDSEVLVKWRFIDQTETFPAVAIGVGGMLPTGNEDKGLNEVVHWGAKVLALVSSESSILDDSFLGLYLEAQAVFIDELVKGGTTSGAERYGTINVGMLFPLSSEGHLQAVVEYNQLLYKNNWRTLYERNFNAVTPALRYVTGHLNVSMGAQLINKEQAGYDNTVRFIGTVSYTF